MSWPLLLSSSLSLSPSLCVEHGQCDSGRSQRSVCLFWQEVMEVQK